MDSSVVSRLETMMPPGAIRELYTVYVEDTRRRIGELELFSAAGDAEAMRRCAHALKGAAAMAGVPGIASIAAGIEAGDFPRNDDTTLFHQLRRACDDVERTMIRQAAHFRAATGEVR
jgi:HPt (histidine-containing phosphotransfer) domain-containing protein